MKKISFIIPVYNCAGYLIRCIQNIHKIGLEQYDIILVNDGSTDDSGQICKNLSKQFPSVKYLYQKNQGVSAARNQGLTIADGDYVIFLDADDVIDAQRFYKLMEKLDLNPDTDMAVFGHSFDYYYKDKLYRTDEMKTPLFGVADRNLWIPQLEELYCTNSLSPIWNKVFRRVFLIENNLYLRKDMFLYEDLEFSLRCMAYCQNILFEPEIIYHYRQNESTIQRLKRIDHIPVIIRQIEAAFDIFIKEQQIPEKKKMTNHILLLLYLVLAREKIAVSDSKEIKTVCDDFAIWYEIENFQRTKSHEVFIEDLLKHRISKLIVERNYTALRHKIAVKVKSSSFYKKE